MNAKADNINNASIANNANFPEKKFSAGSVTATIWKNEHIDDAGTKKSYNTISFERVYKGKNNDWIKTNTLRINDIPKAILVLNKAYEFISLKKTQETA